MPYAGILTVRYVNSGLEKPPGVSRCFELSRASLALLQWSQLCIRRQARIQALLLRSDSFIEFIDLLLTFMIVDCRGELKLRIPKIVA